MAKWRLAKSLKTLRDQLDQSSPDRSKKSDGAIGDQAHATRASDHNPNSAGVVTAIDITHDPEHGITGTGLAAQLVNDARVKYIIWNGRIWKRRTGQWEVYKGKNPHRHHVHVSVLGEAAMYDADDLWPIALSTVPEAARTFRPTLRLGHSGTAVRVLQSWLGITINGTFDSSTEQSVKRFQAKHGLEVDGIVGPKTWKVLVQE